MNDQQSLRARYARVFDSPEGREVLRDIEARAGAQESSFSPDALRMAFNEGRRSMALHIRRMLQREEQPRG